MGKGKKAKGAGKGKGKTAARKDSEGGKVAKNLRKAWKLAEQPAVSEVVAAAMMAAAAALSDGKVGKPSPKGNGGDAADAEAGQLADTLKLIAIDVARRTLESWERKSRASSSDSDPEGGEPLSA